MEILIIFFLIAGLLVGWFFLMRVEILAFLQRVLNAAADKAPVPGQAQTTSTFRVVSVRHAAATPSSISPDKENRMERKNAGSDGGIPKWSIDE